MAFLYYQLDPESEGRPARLITYEMDDGVRSVVDIEEGLTIAMLRRLCRAINPSITLSVRRPRGSPRIRK